MKKRTVLRSIAGVAVSALCVVGVVGLAGCSTATEEEAAPEALTSDTGLTGGVAATVNGVEIEEDKVTRAINNLRLNYSLSEEEDWKEYMEQQKYTTESLREEVLDSFIEQELVLQCAEQLDVTTDDEEIQSYVDKMRENYSSDEAWQTALEGAGYETEDKYKETLRYSILDKKINEKFEAEQDAALTDEALLEAAQESKGSYDGSKKTSHILFSKDDKELAQTVLGQIKNGEITFEDAVAQYSIDEESKANGGDMGWDRLNTDLASEYTSAIMELSAGQMSEVVESKYGNHIIMVTDAWTAPEPLNSTADVPEEILTAIRTETLEKKTDEAMDAWVEETRAANDVVVNPMPDNLPYYVDMSDVYSEEETQEINAAADEQLTEDVAATEQDVTAAEDAAATAAAEEAASTPEGTSATDADTGETPAQ